MRNAAVSALAVLFALGCAATGAPELEPATDGVLPIGAAKADGRNYFEQFRYAIDVSAGTYDSGQPKATFMASTWTDRVNLTSAAGEAVWGDCDLWMLEDGTAYLEYAEWRGNTQTEERIIRTTWSEAEDVLTLPGVGTGVAGTFEGPSIDITFDADLISPGLAGQTLSVIRVRTSSYIGHVERDYAEQER